MPRRALLVLPEKQQHALETLISHQPRPRGGKRTWAFETAPEGPRCAECFSPLDVVAQAEKISTKGKFLPRFYARCPCTEHQVRTFVPLPAAKVRARRVVP